MLRLCNENITEFDLSWYIQESQGTLIEIVRRGNSTIGPGGGRSTATTDQEKIHDEIDYLEEQIRNHKMMKKIMRKK